MRLLRVFCVIWLFPSFGSEIRGCIFRANCTCFQFIHGGKTYEESIIIITQAAKYIPLADPTVEARSTVVLPLIFKLVLKEVVASQELGHAIRLYVPYISAKN